MRFVWVKYHVAVSIAWLLFALLSSPLRFVWVIYYMAVTIAWLLFALLSSPLRFVRVIPCISLCCSIFYHSPPDWSEDHVLIYFIVEAELVRGHKLVITWRSCQTTNSYLKSTIMKWWVTNNLSLEYGSELMCLWLKPYFPVVRSYKQLALNFSLSKLNGPIGL